MAESAEAVRQALQASLRAIAAGLTGVDNVGRSRDGRDLYAWLGAATESVDRAIPNLPCRAGCGTCCEGPVFRVTAAEFAAFKAGTDPAAYAAIRARAIAAYGAHREGLEALAARWRGEPSPPPAGLPGRCPALGEDARCEAYAGRPAVCRLYGYGAARFEGGDAVLVCAAHAGSWQAAAEATGLPELPLPTWSAFERVLQALPGGLAPRPLALWLLTDEAPATPS